MSSDQAGGQRARHSVMRRGHTVGGYLMLAPSLVGIGLFLIVPAFVAIWLSLQKWDLLNPPHWVGLANYRGIFSNPDVLNSFLVTALFTLLVIPSQTALGLWMAALLSKRLPGSTFFRVIYLIPWICAPLALGVVWKWILDPSDGALNALLGIRIEWLSSHALALPAVAFVSVWTQVGYVTLFFLAGMSFVPDELKDAARIDGANERQVFWKVTMPLLRPTTFFVLVTGIISSFQVFDQIYSMTKGGPAGRTEVIASRIYNEVFVSPRIGYAAALAVLLMVVLIVVTLAQQLYFRRRITYDMS